MPRLQRIAGDAGRNPHLPHRQRRDQPAERITANDEERQRQGFEIQTDIRVAAPRAGTLDVRKAKVVDDEATDRSN